MAYYNLLAYQLPQCHKRVLVNPDAIPGLPAVVTPHNPLTNGQPTNTQYSSAS
jgi:hypothetical protein